MQVLSNWYVGMQKIFSHGCLSVSELMPFMLYLNSFGLSMQRIGDYDSRTELSRFSKASSLDFDYRSQSVFVADANKREIISHTIDFTSKTTRGKARSLATKIAANSLAFDWVHKNLYWTDLQQKQIAVINVVSGMRKSFNNTAFNELQCVTVDPRDGQRLLYATDNGESAKIVRMGLDGSNERNLITAGLQSPTGITIGRPKGLLVQEKKPEKDVGFEICRKRLQSSYFLKFCPLFSH